LRQQRDGNRDVIPKAGLLQQLNQVIEETKAVFASVSAHEMLTERRIQGFAVTGWGAVFSCIPHFEAHTQEIICYTRMQLGDRYQFHWQPQTAEEGAPPV